jgi:hypothetical protein
MKARLVVSTVVAGGALLALGGTIAFAGKPASGAALYPAANGRARAPEPR